jgi:hypothetical protein
MTSRARLYAAAHPTSSRQPSLPEAMDIPNADQIRRDHARAAGAARGQASALASSTGAGRAGAPSRKLARRPGPKAKTKSVLRTMSHQPPGVADAGQAAGASAVPLLPRTVRFADTALTSVYYADYTDDDDDASASDACDAYPRGRRRHRGGGAAAGASDGSADPEADPLPPPRDHPGRPSRASKALERRRLARSRTAIIGQLGAGHCPRPPTG